MPEREYAGQVLLNCFQAQRGWGYPVRSLRPVVVMSAGFRVRPGGLQGVGTAIHEQVVERFGHGGRGV
jgi:hypothetical protein